MYRIIVSGWRGASRISHGDIIAEALCDAIRDISPDDPPSSLTLVQGACHLGGVDDIAADLATDWGWTVESHPALRHPTQRFGRWPWAGPRRNEYMCSLGADVLLAFPGPASRGTLDCVRRATNYGIPTRVYPLPA